MRYAAIICARNEEKYIGACLSSLYFQSIKPSAIVVVDDGSQDETALRANYFKEIMPLEVIRKPDKGSCNLGTPRMADTYNMGLDFLSGLKWDYLLILGADTSIPPLYVEILLQFLKMNADQGVVSGRYPGVKENYAAATGRFIKREIIKKLGDRMPRTNAWESSITHCAQFLGYKCKSYPVPIYNLRPPGNRKRSLVGRGRAIKELGYFLPNAIHKALSYAKMGKTFAAIEIMYGYIIHKPKEPLPDWAQFINESQRQAFDKKLKGLFK